MFTYFCMPVNIIYTKCVYINVCICKQMTTLHAHTYTYSTLNVNRYFALEKSSICQCGGAKLQKGFAQLML